MSSTTAIVLIVLILTVVAAAAVTIVILVAIRGFVEVKRLQSGVHSNRGIYDPLDRSPAPFDPPPSNVNRRSG